MEGLVDPLNPAFDMGDVFGTAIIGLQGHDVLGKQFAEGGFRLRLVQPLGLADVGFDPTFVARFRQILATGSPVSLLIARKFISLVIFPRFLVTDDHAVWPTN